MSETTTASQQRKNILVIEDSPEDFEDIEFAFEENNMNANLFHCNKAEDAIDFLLKQGQYSNDQTPKPDLILMDLNMPGMDGEEMLKYIRNSPVFASIPVIILTTSRNENDVKRCYRAGANSYINKSVDVDQFITTIRKLKQYWLNSSMLPQRKV
jgi:CheY-like chemotaxis protein